MERKKISFCLKIGLWGLVGIFFFAPLLRAEESELDKLRKYLKQLFKKLQQAENKGEKEKIFQLRKKMGQVQREITSHLSLKRVLTTIERLKKLYKLYQYFGQKDEAQKVMKILERLGRFLPSTPGRASQMAKIQQRVFYLLKKVQQARKKGQYRLANTLAKEWGELEKAINLFRDDKTRKRHERLIKERKKLILQIRKLTDEAVGAMMRGDRLRARELAGKIKKSNHELDKLQENRGAINKALGEIRMVIQTLQARAEEAQAKGDQKRYLELRRELDKLAPTKDGGKDKKK